MANIKISTKYWNECSEIEQSFIAANVVKHGVQSCKTAINLIRKYCKGTLLSIQESNIKSIGGTFVATLCDGSSLLVCLSSGFIGDANKVYLIEDNTTKQIV